MFKNKVVIVTGASTGIGAAIAIKFVEEGANVVIIARNEAKLKNVSEKCKKKGIPPLIIAADVTKDEDVHRILNNTINCYGKLDVLVNNVGILATANITAENALSVFDKVMTTNLRSMVAMTNATVPYLIKSQGNIINNSSIASMGIYMSENFAYCTSKAAVDHFTRAIALELGPKNVRVNTINPGPVKTDIISNSGYISKEREEVLWRKVKEMAPLKKIVESEEVADLVLFLASDKAKSITGGSFVIDNGVMLKNPFEL